VGARQPEETRKILAEVNPDLLVRKRAEGPRFESPFEEEVCRAIADRGYQMDAQVGLSGYRIDLAVIDPSNPQRYCLGIECDGATFHSGRSVRERDVSRQLFLESRGWTIHRVWSRHWWMDRQGEVAKVLAKLPPVPGPAGPPA
jgi:very-short-patch-repair endonuclease